MVKVLVFTLGIITGLAFSRIPHYAVIPFQLDKGPRNPVGWEPRYRTWKEGVEQ